MSLPGNVHATRAQTYPTSEDAAAIVEAHLALAEEQRTANLIAILVGTNPISGMPLLAAQGTRDRVADAVTSRLALLDGAL